MLEVSTAATATKLTTRDAVKLELGITKQDDDVWMDGQIEAASSLCCAYLGVPMATDGSMRLGRETLIETIRLNRAHPFRHRWDIRRRELLLSRWPVTEIASISIDGDALTGTDYEVDGSSGSLMRLNNDQPSFWVGNKIIVTYTAGWVLPGTKDDAGQTVAQTLPNDIEHACIELVKAEWFTRKRDPLAKSENIPGVRDVQYWVGSVPGTNGALPPDVTAMLDPYRYFPMR